MKIDEIDRNILQLLQEDSKLNINSLSEKLNLTKTPVYERIKRLENEGVIKQYVAIVNEELIFGGMFVFCSVSLESQKLSEIQKFKEEIKNLEEIKECYLMGGTNDFLLKVHVKDLKEYHHFSSGKLAALSNVSQIKSTFVLETIKKSHAITIPSLQKG